VSLTIAGIASVMRGLGIGHIAHEDAGRPWTDIFDSLMADDRKRGSLGRTIERIKAAGNPHATHDESEPCSHQIFPKPLKREFMTCHIMSVMSALKPTARRSCLADDGWMDEIALFDSVDDVGRDEVRSVLKYLLHHGMVIVEERDPTMQRGPFYPTSLESGGGHNQVRCT
jgi:hypothetical protein